MKSGSKFSDSSQIFHLTCGEMATVEKDVNGFWGFTTNKGYNLWEGERETKSRKDCLILLREYDSKTVENQKHETN